MKQQGISSRALAEQIGMTPEHLNRMLRQEIAGSFDAWVKVCEALYRGDILAHILPAYTRKCAICEAEFVDNVIRRENSRRYRMTCSDKCGRTWAHRVKKKGNDARGARNLTNMRRRLVAHQDAVGAFCRSCEPLSVCRDDECHLRTVSPLPFIPMSQATRRAG